MHYSTMAIEKKTGKELCVAADGGVWVGENFYPAGVTPTVGEVEPADDGSTSQGHVDENYRIVLERLGRSPVERMSLHRANQPGDPETRVVRCPDCGQMEIWSEQECSDHGLCRRSGKPCPVCGQSLA